MLASQLAPFDLHFTESSHHRANTIAVSAVHHLLPAFTHLTSLTIDGSLQQSRDRWSWHDLPAGRTQFPKLRSLKIIGTSLRSIVGLLTSLAAPGQGRVRQTGYEFSLTLVGVKPWVKDPITAQEASQLSRSIRVPVTDLTLDASAYLSTAILVGKPSRGFLKTLKFLACESFESGRPRPPYRDELRAIARLLWEHGKTLTSLTIRLPSGGLSDVDLARDRFELFNLPELQHLSLEAHGCTGAQAPTAWNFGNYFRFADTKQLEIEIDDLMLWAPTMMVANWKVSPDIHAHVQVFASADSHDM